MKNFGYIIILLIVLIAQSACKKESSSFEPDDRKGINDTTWVSNFDVSSFLPELELTPLKDTFDASSDEKYVLSDSIEINIPANALRNASGALISGNVIMEAVVLLRKGDFIRFDKPTIDYPYVLDAGVFININLTQNGQEVFLMPGAAVEIEVKDAAAKNNNDYFFGTKIKYNSSDSVFSWSKSATLGNAEQWTDAQTILGHEIHSARLHWFGSAVYLDSTQTKQRVNVYMPPNFTNKNTKVYAVYKNTKSVVNLFSDPDTRTWYTTDINANTDITLISVSKIFDDDDDDYFIGTAVRSSSNASAVKIVPSEKDLKDIKAFLDSLQ
jgi:hypothetical protein